MYAVTGISEKVWKVLERGTDENGPIGHGWTYSAHPIGAAAGIANLNLIDKLGLVNNAGEVGSYSICGKGDNANTPGHRSQILLQF